MLCAFVLPTTCGPHIAQSAEPHAAAPAARHWAEAPYPLKGTDVAGQQHWLGRFAGCRAICLVFIHPECPISNKYLPELARLAERFAAPQVDFNLVVSDARLTRATVARFVDEFKPVPRVLFDHAGELATWLQPERVPQAFVISPSGDVLYAGRIDNQWAAVGRRRAVADVHDLADGLEQVCQGEPVEMAQTEPIGCLFEGLPTGDSAPEVNFARHIAPVLRNNCENCHRAGEVAPFDLGNYDDAAGRRRMLAEVAASGQMPPWKAARSAFHFDGERRLSRHEIALLAAFASGDAPRGSDDDLPPPAQFAPGWQLGEPDLVLEMTEPFDVPAEGADVLRYFVSPAPLPENAVVKAVEFRPGNRRVCHHSIMYLDSSGIARKRDAADPTPGYSGFITPGFQPAGMLGFWAPGYRAQFLRPGVGNPLRVTSALDLAMQLHYYPDGKPESDRSRVGLHFAKPEETITHETGALVMGVLAVDIPAGEKAYRLQTSLVLPVAVEASGITPHMHLIGRKMRLVAYPPAGEPLTLLDVDRWDFNWQDQYHFVEPLRLPAQSRLELEAEYDNSADNAANPNSPPARITFGEESTDEMCLCVVHTVCAKGSDEPQALRRAMGQHFMKQITPQFLEQMSPEMKEALTASVLRGNR